MCKIYSVKHLHSSIFSQTVSCEVLMSCVTVMWMISQCHMFTTQYKFYTSVWITEEVKYKWEMYVVTIAHICSTLCCIFCSSPLDGAIVASGVVHIFSGHFKCFHCEKQKKQKRVFMVKLNDFLFSLLTLLSHRAADVWFFWVFFYTVKALGLNSSSSQFDHVRHLVSEVQYSSLALVPRLRPVKKSLSVISRIIKTKEYCKD